MNRIIIEIDAKIAELQSLKDDLEDCQRRMDVLLGKKLVEQNEKFEEILESVDAGTKKKVDAVKLPIKRNYPDRVCVRCNRDYTPTSPNQAICPSCKERP